MLRRKFLALALKPAALELVLALLPEALVFALPPKALALALRWKPIAFCEIWALGVFEYSSSSYCSNPNEGTLLRRPEL